MHDSDRSEHAPGKLSSSDGPTHLLMVEIDPEENVFDWCGDGFFGHPLEAFGTALDDLLSLIHPDDRSALSELISQPADKRVHPCEIRLKYHTDNYRWALFRCVVKTDLVHQRRKILGTLEDATHLRADNQLRVDRDRLSVLNQELTEFAYAASHDLQEPLRTITAFAELLAEDYSDKLDNDGREYLSFIHESTSRLQQLISDLLAYSRLSSKAESSAEVDLSGVCNEVLQDLYQKREDTSPQIQLTHLPTIQGDRSRLVRLFQNLINNALKFRKPEKLPLIKITAEERDEHWLISIADNGIGIPPEQRERVFGIFFRLHSQNTYPGTGIGLAICAKIVAQHGGKIWAEESETGGTTIHLTLAK